MPNYKLICSDIDGTLLNKERQLSDRTINAIKNLDSTIPVILISSRMPKAMRHLQHELDIQNQPLIAYNGGLVLSYDDNNVAFLLSKEVPIGITTQLLAFISKSTVHASLYNTDEWYVPAMDYWAKREKNNTKVDPTVANLNDVCSNWKSQNKGPHKIMCMGEAGEIQLLENWINMYHAKELNAYRSKPTYLEISSKQISKLSALSFLLEQKFPVSLEEVIAFGDNYNDIEMIQGVGLGVAVGNAKEEVKAVANRLTLSNLEDGVAVVLEEVF
ncbi:MAG: Cof subfamily protein (haloacid dehalogenase superfamily) [Polaribacter sp.]|jgi:Cof subfamily protein (haloacid dehalogenase superfamily)